MNCHLLMENKTDFHRLLNFISTNYQIIIPSYRMITVATLNFSLPFKHNKNCIFLINIINFSYVDFINGGARFQKLGNFLGGHASI